MKEIKIIIVDDHAFLADGLCHMLNQEDDIMVIGQANNGEHGIELVNTLNPDIVLMDISMCEIDGVTATSLILKENKNCKVIALTMHDEPYLVHEMLKAGASGYVLKDSPYQEFINGIRSVNSGEVYLSPRIATLIIKSHYKNYTDATGNTLSSLTKREREIFNFFVIGTDNQTVADSLSISVKTVLTHRRNLMSKLNCHSLSELTRFAHNNLR
jgi:DNA-binding NarL/FixJ family response regulator